MFPYFKASSKFEDTLAYLTTASFEKFAIVLSDVCTTLKDVAYLTIRLRTPIEIKTILEDTSPCSGNKIVYIVKAAAGNSSMYQWQWKDLTTNTILSKTDSLGLITKQTFKIELTVDDGCVNLGDAQQFTVFFNPPSEASILTDNGQFNDTSLCFNQSLKLFLSGKGGTGTGYNFNWYLDKTLVSSSDTFYLNSNLLSPKSFTQRQLHQRCRFAYQKY